jgi:hypothetical protein
MPRKQALLEVGVRPRPRYYFAEGGLCFIAHRTLLRKENENQKSTSRLHCNRDSPYEVLPTQKSVPRIGITCKQLASDGRPKRDPFEKGPISGHSVMKRAREPHCRCTGGVGFIVVRCFDRHAGHGFGLRQSMRRRMSANRSRGMVTSAIWKVT